jgi:hypothetical protein
MHLLSLLRSGDVGCAIDCIENTLGIDPSDDDSEDGDSDETEGDAVSPEVLQEFFDAGALLQVETPIDEKAGIYRIDFGKWVADEIQEELLKVEHKNRVESATMGIIW